MITTKRDEAYPKAQHRHVSLSLELSIDAISYGFLSQNTKERSWKPRGLPREKEGVRNEGEGRAIYRENPPPTT
jgi:hypothetical protein